jgi:hypothetical protein
MLLLCSLLSLFTAANRWDLPLAAGRAREAKEERRVTRAEAHSSPCRSHKMARSESTGKCVRKEKGFISCMVESFKGRCQSSSWARVHCVSTCKTNLKPTRMNASCEDKVAPSAASVDSVVDPRIT